MSEWWTYSPADLLLFSPRVHDRLFELHNEALWPAHVVALLLGLLILALTVRPIPASGALIGAVLGVSWIWVAWSFLWERYATINWPVAYIAPLFAVQGIMLILVALRRDRLAPVHAKGFVRRGSIILLGAAVLVYPLVAVLAGRPWRSAEMLAVFPDPTAVATLAALVLADRRTLSLMIVPAAWCVLSSGVLWLLGSADFFLPAAAAACAIALRLARGSMP